MIFFPYLDIIQILNQKYKTELDDWMIGGLVVDDVCDFLYHLTDQIITPLIDKNKY